MDRTWSMTLLCTQFNGGNTKLALFDPALPTWPDMSFVLRYPTALLLTHFLIATLASSKYQGFSYLKTFASTEASAWSSL